MMNNYSMSHIKQPLDTLNGTIIAKFKELGDMFKLPVEANRQALALTVNDSDSDESDDTDSIIDSAPNQRVQATSQPGVGGCRRYFFTS